MPSTPALLFVYGTLHPRRAPREIAAVANRLKPIGPATGRATIRGRLLDLGNYPGLLLAKPCDPETEPDSEASNIPGHLFEVPDLATLAALDAYEDFRPGDPAASLFLRVEATATLGDGSTLRCWVYVYNRH
ncbi:MAG TPA: gamma-glutamylcyclotransferase family protein [Acidobacteriaceae bacterium]